MLTVIKVMSNAL